MQKSKKYREMCWKEVPQNINFFKYFRNPLGPYFWIFFSQIYAFFLSLWEKQCNYSQKALFLHILEHWFANPDWILSVMDHLGTRVVKMILLFQKLEHYQEECQYWNLWGILFVLDIHSEFLKNIILINLIFRQILNVFLKLGIPLYLKMKAHRKVQKVKILYWICYARMKNKSIPLA